MAIDRLGIVVPVYVMDISKVVSVISVVSTVVAIVGWIRECTRQQVSRDRSINEVVLDVRELRTQVNSIEDLLQRLELLVLRDGTKKN